MSEESDPKIARPPVGTVSVTTEHGTFTAKSMRAAKKLAADAAVRIEAEQKHNADCIEHAYERAKAACYRMLLFKLGARRKAFEFYPANYEYYGHLVKVDPARPREHAFYTEKGTGILTLSGLEEVTGVVVTGNGYVLGFAVKREGHAAQEFYGIGVCEGHCASEHAPSLTWDDFEVQGREAERPVEVETPPANVEV